MGGSVPLQVRPLLQRVHSVLWHLLLPAGQSAATAWGDWRRLRRRFARKSGLEAICWILASALYRFADDQQDHCERWLKALRWCAVYCQPALLLSFASRSS